MCSGYSKTFQKSCPTENNNSEGKNGYSKTLSRLDETVFLVLMFGSSSNVISLRTFQKNWLKEKSIYMNRPLSLGGHVESQDNKKLCFSMASLALNSRLGEACLRKTSFLFS